MNDERWLPVVGYEGIYEISDLGRVKSIARLGIDGRRLRERILKPKTRKRGYREVHITKDRGFKSREIQSLVLEAFVGPRPVGCESCHNNGNPGDNRRHNLRWGTRRDNRLDSKRHGTIYMKAGGQHPFAKLTEPAVLQIRRSYASGAHTQQELAQQYGVSFQLIHRIVRRLNWTHI